MFRLVAIAVLLAAPAFAPLENAWAKADASRHTVTAEESDRGARILVNGELFCEYLTSSGRQPAIWPVIGPTGVPMTRSYPQGPLEKHEVDDHPHHRSIWFSHGEVNGLDFWAARGDDRGQKGPVSRIVHQKFTAVENRDGEAVVASLNQWIGKDGKPVCDDQRMVRFGADEQVRWIDYKTTLIAAHGDVTFGDTKEGTFGTRVAGSMKVDAELGGRAVNSEGQHDADAWGQPADWVDYYGPVHGEVVGLAIFSYPSNFRHPCRWHVRNYGLFAANPFGKHHFPKGEPEQGEVTIRHGDTLTLRYRVLLHRGDVDDAQIARRYAAFAAAPNTPLETSPQAPPARPRTIE